jgi:PncC family amidohydrolase
LGGVVAYHDSLKLALLDVAADLVAAHGAVSQEVAEAMAHGVRQATSAALGVAATGIAGPGGATPTKPVGLAYLAVTDGQRTISERHTWHGTRAENRARSAEAAIALVLGFLDA